MAVPDKKAVATAYPASHGYEFGGPIGAFGVTFGLPILVYLFAFLCNDISGCPVPSALSPKSLTLEQLKLETGWPEEGIMGLFDVEVLGYVLAYYASSLLLQIILPGNVVEGTKLRSGGTLKYKMNAFSSSLVTLGALLGGTFVYGVDFPVWSFIWNNHLKIISANLLIVIFLSVYVYVASFSVPKPGEPNPEKRELAAGGHSGNILYDFFIGRELNPRITLPIPFVSEAAKTVDIKSFCELRPGLTGWIILNISNIVHQYQSTGTWSISIYLITAFQAFYVLDSFYMEPAILTTMDITTDGFGYMLCFGDLIWVPFVYTLQTRYLAVFPVFLGKAGLAAILVVQGIGYFIFRGANNEKNRFRTNPSDPKVAHLKYIDTQRGTRLLISGWWGRARHINYFGDWIMGWSYCLPTGVAGYIIHNHLDPETGALTRNIEQGDARGFGMLITYFYIVYFAVLLIHRERRDEQDCKKKYGSDWNRYTKIVPSRIVPYIY